MWPAASLTAVALAIEFVDELADGTRGAAFPLIRGTLHLSYAQVGLLIGLPLLAGGVIELPLGVVAGEGRRRHRFVLAGGAAVAASLASVALARSFLGVLVAFVAFFPASGAFVSLTQADLVDADLERGERRMAAWNLAGSAGSVAGPLLLAAVLIAGGTWRSAYLLLAAAAAGPLVALAIIRRRAHAPDSCAAHDAAQASDGGRALARQAVSALRDGRTIRWLVLLQVSDLLLDVLTGYVGVYLVDVAHASPAVAAVGVAIRLGAYLLGGAGFVPLSARVSGEQALRVTAVAACLLFPAFLLVPALPAKLAILAVLTALTACWYPVIQAGLYRSLPGRSGVAVTLASASGLAGAAGPLAVGFIAQEAGLTWALTGLIAVPAAIVAILPRGRERGGG